MRLLDAPLESVYQIVSIDLPEESQRHLSNLGIKAGVNLKWAPLKTSQKTYKMR